MMDPTAQTIIETIGDTGYSIMIGADDVGCHVVEAVDIRTGEYFVVRGDDLYTVAVELAEQISIEPKDT